MMTCPDLDLGLSSNHPLFLRTSLQPKPWPTTLARTPRLIGGLAYATLATTYGTLVPPPSADNRHGAFNPEVSAGDDNTVRKIDFDEDSTVFDGSSTVRSLRETLVGADLALARLETPMTQLRFVRQRPPRALRARGRR